MQKKRINWKIALPALVITVAFIFGGMYYGLTYDTVTAFRYQDMKKYSNGVIEAPGALECEVFIYNAEQTDQSVRRQSYGIIAVVKVIESENVLVETLYERTEKTYGGFDVKGYRKIAPWETIGETLGTKLKQPILYGSYVRTKAEILEIIYQTDATDCHAGDSIWLQENYYILDGRVPDQLKAQAGSDAKYDVNNPRWIPMEAGETYIVFGSVSKGNIPEKYEPLSSADLYPHNNGVYCLSDPAKKAGWWPQEYESRWRESVAYLKENYDLEKYGLK